MARKPIMNKPETTKIDNVPTDDFSKDMMSEINKSLGEREVWNFESTEDTTIKRYIPTGCKQLDYLISNKKNGGYPEGKIIEIFGPPSIGKSLLGYQAIKSAQKMGGIGVLIDTEQATLPEYLEELGIDTRNRFVFSPQKCIEKIFGLIELIIKSATNKKTDAPIVLVWDSIAASASKAELECDYEKLTIGASARALSAGMKKIVDVVGKHNITLLLLNQTRTKIGVIYGDPEESTGGAAIKYYASVRIKLSGGSSIYQDENKKELGVIGNNVIATTIKNKVASPRRKCNFDLIFGQGSYENDQLFDSMRQKGVATSGDKQITLEGTGAWKTIRITDLKTNQVLSEDKFRKDDFISDILENPKYVELLSILMDEALIKTRNDDVNQEEEKEEEGETENGQS